MVRLIYLKMIRIGLDLQQCPPVSFLDVPDKLGVLCMNDIGVLSIGYLVALEAFWTILSTYQNGVTNLSR